MSKTNYAHTHHNNQRLGFGGWQLGNTDFWGFMSVEDGVELVKESISLGVHFFDTAPGYASGLSETIIGMAIQDQREKVFINTKIGHTADGETDFSVFSMREQIFSSLERLQTSYLDSVLLHNPPMDILEGKTRHVEEFELIKSEGLIKNFGVSIDTFEEFETVLNHLDVDVIEILFNVFFQEPARLFKQAHEKGIKIIVKVPLDSGWLTGKYDEFSEFEGIRMRWDDDTISRRASLVSDLKSITRTSDLTRYAMAFILSYPEVSYVIPGIKDIEHLKQHLKHIDFKLSSDMKEAFMQLYEKKIKDDPLYW